MDHTRATVLPFDVQMLVVDAASTMESTDILRTCALTCHAWLSRARRHLYLQIILLRRRQLALLARTVTESPELGALIRDLRLILTNTGVVLNQWDHIPFTPYAISQLTSLRSVAFGCYFTPMPPSFPQFMRIFATRPTVKTLYFLPMRFRAFADIVRVVLSFPSVEALCFTSSRWDETGDIVNTSEYPGHGRSLRELKLFNLEGGDMFLRLFAHYSITGIEWWPSDDIQGMHHYAALSSYTLLEEVELHCPNGNSRWVVDFLRCIRSQRIRRLSVVHSCHGQPMEQTMRQWSDAQVDDILSESPFTHLQQLRMCFLCLTAETAETQRWQKMVEHVFPRCHQRGLIKLEIVDQNTIE